MPRGKPEKYLGIASGIVELISRNKIRRGQALPSERKLALDFHCSQLTIRKALRKLEQENLIHKVPSIGNFAGPRSEPGNVPQLIGIVFPDDDIYYYRLLVRLERIFESLNLYPIIKLTNRIATREDEVLEFFCTQGVRAVIAVPNEQCAKRYEQLRCPVIFFDLFPEESQIPRVISDDFAGAVSAVEYLCALGHRRIAYIGSALDPSSRSRFDGYQTVLKKHGLEIDKKYIKNHSLTREWGIQAARELLELTEPPEAVFCGNDTAAAGVIRYCIANRIEIPAQLSVIGFGDTEIAEDLSLSSVSQHSDKLAAVISENLILLLTGREIPRETVIPTTLIIRHSTGSRLSEP